MLRSTLEALARRYVPGSGGVAIRPLAAGLTNESYCVSRGGAQYGLRVAIGGARDLGLDPGWECRVLGAAAAADLAPAILHCEHSHGVLVTEWVVGRTWTPQEISRPAAVATMAGLLRRVHSLPIPMPARIMHPVAWIALYENALAAGPRQQPARWPREDLSAALERQLELLAEAEPATPVLCHSDLHRYNLVVGDAALGGGTGARAILLDWEYAHVTDPWWDLAGWASNNDWQAAEAERLASRYLGRAPAAGERARLDSQLWLYDYVCLLWSELYLRQRAGLEPTPSLSVQSVASRGDALLRRLRRVR
jgi:thiamine kinase-like enzyme